MVARGGARAAAAGNAATQRRQDETGGLIAKIHHAASTRGVLAEQESATERDKEGESMYAGKTCPPEERRRTGPMEMMMFYANKKTGGSSTVSPATGVAIVHVSGSCGCPRCPCERPVWAPKPCDAGVRCLLAPMPALPTHDVWERASNEAGYRLTAEAPKPQTLQPQPST